MPGDDLPRWQQKLKEDIGENPARFLDHRLVERGEDHTDYTLARMVRDRITGIDRIEVVRAWKAVERRLDRGPRDAVLQLLDQREEYLEEHGERPDDLRTEWPQDLPDRYDPTLRDREVPSKDCVIITEDGERIPYTDKRKSSAAARLNSIRESDPEEIATDGGESA